MTASAKTDLRAFNGRKQLPDYEEKRTTILDAAAALFAKEGFDRTSVGAVAASCNISKSALYHYFPSKEDMLYEVCASFISGIQDEIDKFDCSTSGGSLLDELRALLRIIMRRFAQGIDRQTVLLNDVNLLPAGRRNAIAAQQRKVLNRVQSLMLNIRPDLVSDPAEGRVRAMLMFGMLNWTMNWYDPAGPVGPDRLVDIMLDMIFERRSSPEEG